MKKFLSLLDWWLLGPVIILVTLSLVTLYSLNPLFFEGQAVYVLCSFGVFLFISQIDYRILKSLTKWGYFTSIILLAIIFIIGFESKGAVRWISFFGVSVQFSELCKPLAAISLSGFLSNYEERGFRAFLLSCLLLLPLMFLIMLQPDLGNALIYAVVLLCVLFSYGFNWKWFMLLFLGFAISLPVLWERLHDYQQKRLLTFINPMSDPTGSSYNVIQAIIAVGSGSLIGKGLSSGTQSGLRFLPERQTDFIFASLSEALGFIGSALVVICFVILCKRIFDIFNITDDLFGKLLVSCAFFFIVVHFFVNIGMNIGIVPVVGVTLPFVSYGGSSLLTNFILLGLVSSVAQRNKKQTVLEIR